MRLVRATLCLAVAGAVQPSGVPWIGHHALRAAQQHEAVAQVAVESAHASHDAMLSAQEALSASDAAAQSADFLAAQVDPSDAIQKELAKAQDWAQQARAYAEHAQQTAAAMRKLPQEAVENVTKAVEEEVRREAYAAAERRAAEPTPSPEALRAAKKLEAEEPYRQAAERAQQSAALSMAKSQRAAEAVNRLAEESQALAKKAQALQEKGEALPAQHAMIEAHQRMKQELLTADDVAKTMSFYTDICASQNSISASMKATWECKLFDIRVEKPEGGSWDPTTNHALPDVDKDTLMNGTRGILETKARTNKTNKELAKERRYEIKQICSENFFQTHFIIGDDPRKVPLGDVNAFAQRVRQVHPGLNPVFDQFLLHDQGFGGMKQMLNEIKEEVKEIKESQKELDHDGGRRLSTRLQRRSPWLLDVDLESNRSEEVPAKPAEALEAKATNATAAAQGLTFPANHSGINGSVAKDQNFPSGCFDPGDVAGLLRDLWVSYAGSDDTEWGLNEEDAKGMAKEVLPNVGSDTWPQYWEEMNPDGDLKLSGEEFLVFAEKHLKEFQWPIRGYLNSECRNHHFSLISLCKPQEISAHYQVAFVPGKKNSAGIFFTQQRINVLLSFKQVTDQSGWYRTNLRIFNKSCIGSETPGTVILMVLTLILFSFLTLIDSLATLILLPLNLYRILWMDLPSDASIEEIETCFWRKFLQGLDARGVASRFLPVLIVLAERLLALGFILSCVEAVKESRMNTVLPFGVLSESCMVTWFRGNKGWIIGRNVPRGINMINYINECTDVAGVDYLAELFFEVLFEDEGCFHALVVGLIMLRILEAFSLSSRLNWLPRTLFLAKNKLQNFLLAYVCLVAGFSLIMTLYFGDIFQQFSSLQESFCTLLLYSFGSTERALYGSKPFIEVGSSHLHAALFFYTVFAVTIILNMFTTIVIDAFTAEGDPERYEKIYKEETQSLTSQLLQVFGKGHLLNKKSQLTRQASSEDKAET